MHQLIHTGTKAHVCQICKNNFTQLGSLNRHQQLHEEPKHHCDICEKKFHDRSDLLAHKSAKHMNPKQMAAEAEKIHMPGLQQNIQS